MWIAASGLETPGTFRWLGEGEEVSFDAWAEGEPAEELEDGELECVAMDPFADYGWKVANCEASFAPICQYNLE